MNEPKPSSVFAVILAGGSGTRFWPLSRTGRPKQLLALFENDPSMLELSLSRLEGLVARENILILTNSQQLEGVRAVVGHRLPAENILAEPEKRDTAPAIALALGWVAARDPAATMMVLPSDHLIRNGAAFQKTMRQAIRVADREGGIVTIGIKPSWPCTAYGYIQKGRQKPPSPGDENTPPVYQVDSFREKPNAQLAQEFLERGNYSWNAGIFVWQLATAVGELQKHCPELAAFVGQLRTSPDFPATVAGGFSRLPKISIDYALMEKAACVLNIEAEFDWDDLGDWPSAGKYFIRDANGNACRAKMTALNSANNVVYAEGDVHVALLGIDHCVVVQTADAVLIAAKDKLDGLKELVDGLPAELQ